MIFISWPDVVIVVNDLISEWYQKTYGERIKKIVILQNRRSINELRRQKTDYLHKYFHLMPDVKVVLYQGVMGTGRGIKQLIQAAERCTNKSIAFIALGDGALVESLCASKAYNKNLFWHPFVAVEKLGEITQSADIGWCVIEPVCLSYDFALPNKFFEYLSAEIPMVLSNTRSFQDLQSRFKLGITLNVDEFDPEQCVRQIEEMIKLYSVYVQQVNLALNHFREDKLEQAFCNILSGGAVDTKNRNS